MFFGVYYADYVNIIAIRYTAAIFSLTCGVYRRIKKDAL